MNRSQNKIQSAHIKQNYPPLLCITLVPVEATISQKNMSLDCPFSPKIAFTKAGISTQVGIMIVPFISEIPHLLTFQLTFYRLLVCVFLKKNPVNCVGKTLHCYALAGPMMQLLLFKG